MQQLFVQSLGGQLGVWMAIKFHTSNWTQHTTKRDFVFHFELNWKVFKSTSNRENAESDKIHRQLRHSTRWQRDGLHHHSLSWCAQLRREMQGKWLKLTVWTEPWPHRRMVLKEMWILVQGVTEQGRGLRLVLWIPPRLLAHLLPRLLRRFVGVTCGWSNFPLFLIFLIHRRARKLAQIFLFLAIFFFLPLVVVVFLIVWICFDFLLRNVLRLLLV